MHRPRSFLRSLAITGLVLLTSVGVMTSPITTPLARAIPVEVVANPIEDIGRILDQILTQLLRAAVVALYNAAQTFLGQVAYDAANYVASGGKGQGALTQAKSPGDYFAKVGEDALGSAIGSLSDEFFKGSLGFDLCRPPNPENLLNLQISLGGLVPSPNGAFTRPAPSCDFQQVIRNYDTFFTTLSSMDLLKHMGASFNPSTSEIGGNLQIFGRSVLKVSEDVQKAQQTRAEDGAFKGVTDVISGNVKTPASLVAEQTKSQLVDGPSRDEGAQRNAILSSAVDQGPMQLITYTASMFINTLGSKLMSRIMEKGLVGAFDFSDLDKQTAISAANPDAVATRSRTDSRRANLDLKNVNLIRQSTVEILADLIACPDVRGTWNCAMDQQLAQAISGKACDNGACTIAAALSKGFLKGDWKLYPDALVRQNQDKQCYQSAYCSGNLKKLRLMRILPVGFEFAANDEANIARCASSGGCVTLKEVTDNFTNCSDQGARDAEHPWCKLIDPNWTLTMFPQQCRLTGYGETVISERLGQRAEECQDIQTCLQRNDKGECTGGYGYCVAEKTVYRFKADECPSQDASCRNYATPAGAQVSLLRNTLDYGNCAADNVGCLGYATKRVSDGASWVNDPTSFTYFDTALKACGAQDDGCTKLLVAEVGGTALNLIGNPSFERLNTSGKLQEWESSPAGTYTAGRPIDGRASQDGSLTLELATGASYFQKIAVNPGRVLTLSVYARAKTTGVAPTLNVVAMEKNVSGARIPGVTADSLFKSPSCDAGSRYPSIGGTTPGLSTLGTDWVRFTCSFLAWNEVTSVELTMTGNNVLVDAIELEDGQFVTPFVDGVNRSLPVTHIKVAADDLSCTGATTDPAICGKFASSCRQVDAGCQGYKDTNGSPEVPAILSSNDVCPSMCVGYAEYRKQPSTFDLVVDPDPLFSDSSDEGKAFFIPSTGKSCKQADVGCETFTNLETSAAGGESSPAYSYVRLCEKPATNPAETYFTWEGSDSAGYQLRTWSLVQSETGTGPKIVSRRGQDGSFKLPSSCDEPRWRTGYDPDCRQFYDRAGTVFYAYESQTVLSTDSCSALRLGRVSNREDCGNTGGRFDDATGQCTYHVLAEQSVSCSALVAGCRAYAGAGAGSVTTVVDENFRAGKGVFSAGAASTESLLVGDQSLRLQGTGDSSLTTSVPFPSQSSDLFRVSFWAKAAGTGLTMRVQLGDGASAAATPVDVGTANLSGDWQRFSFGLFNGYTGTATSSLKFTLSGGVAFFDQVRVENLRDTAYVVANSWSTPDQCDRTFAGVPEPQAMLGCREYTDRFNNKIDAARFTRLCTEKAIGCRAFVDTRNSESASSETFVQADATPIPVHTLAAGVTPVASDYYPSATTTRAADKVLYLIYDTAKLCQPENDSCRAFGKPVFSTDRNSIDSFETVYFKDDITSYGQALCKPSEQFCSEFSYNGASDYFKDPGEKSCEYKDNINLTAFDLADAPADVCSILNCDAFADGVYSGWFRKGGNIPCYPANLQSGNFFGLPKKGDEPYTGWVGMCEPANGECTEFRDPNDTTDPDHRSGKPYYFIDNSKLDKTSCASNYDQGAGCILLSNTNDPSVRYSTLATDLAYRANNYRAVQPINCDLDASNPYCAGRCTGKKVTRTGSSSTEVDYVGLPCTTDDQCVIPAEGVVSYRMSCVTPVNDSNALVKVSTDRDCSQWLGCQSAETVFDTATNQYKDICTNLTLCDKVSGEPNDIFCGHYVDRSQQKTEPVLYQGSFFDANAYSARSIGLGQRDYDGYALPDSFQIPDTKMSRVAVDGALTVKDSANTFARDYRLVALAQIPVEASSTSIGSLYLAAATPPNKAFVLDAPNNSDIHRANPGLNLCKQKQTGLIGYYVKSERDSAVNEQKPYFNCYLPLRRESDSYDFQKLVSAFTLPDPRTNVTLSKAFPEPECRSQPEADSPYAEKYVTKWDLSKNPPVPTAKLSGFQNAHTCEYGEDCSCGYKRAEYETPSLTKFYSPLSSGVLPGTCFGGPRNGQSCLPTAILQTTGGTSASVDQGVQAANAEQTCGDATAGGRCIAPTKIQVIRGIFGQCLERDTTRILGGDRAAQPCLTWNPNPILFGDKDPFHYQPTSGYMPPQNSGQYYCTSPTQAPVAFKLSNTDFRRFYQRTDPIGTPDPSRNTYLKGNTVISCRDLGISRFGEDQNGADSSRINLQRQGRSCDPPFNQGDIQGGAGSSNLDNYEKQFDAHDRAPLYAGKMSRLDFGAQWLEDDNRCAPSECDYMSASLVEAHPLNHYPSASQCTAAYNASNSTYSPNADALRLVDAGSSDQGNSYTETFFRINDEQFTKKLGATVPADWDRLLSDNVIGYFRINPAAGNSGNGLLGCGYQAGWVDNMSDVNYGDAGSLGQGERQFRNEFMRSYNPYLTRATETVLAKGSAINAEAIKMDCVKVDNAAGTGGGATELFNPFIEAATTTDGVSVPSEPSKCYFKYWETGYRNTSDKTQQFQGLYATPGSNEVERQLDDIRKQAVTGVCTSAKPYFGIRAVFQARANPVDKVVAGAPHFPVVAQDVISGAENWRFVGFWVSACAGQSASDQRFMYMNVEVGSATVCSELAEVQSKSSRQDAAFTDRVWSEGGFREQNIGTTYSDAASPFSSAINTRPADKEPLFQTGQELAGFSRLNPPTFLRSGITTYYANAKYPRDKWSFLSNLFARIYRIYQFRYYPVNRGDLACTKGPFKGTKCNTAGADKACKIDGVCSSGLMGASDLSSIRVCNRGPQRGIQCSTTSECKAAAFRGIDNSLVPLLSACGLDSAWTLASGTLTDPNAKFSSAGFVAVSRARAAENNAFKCGTGSVNVGVKCNAPSDHSKECPTALAGSFLRTGSGSATLDRCVYPRAAFAGSGLETLLSSSAALADPLKADIVNGRMSLSNNLSGQCDFTLTEFTEGDCVPVKDYLTDTGYSWYHRWNPTGRCVGGVKNGQLCVTDDISRVATADNCVFSYGDGTTDKAAVDISCARVDASPGFTPIPECLIGTSAPNPSTDADSDNNSCTNSGGYQPRLDICPNPNDEYCGLIAYDMRPSSIVGSGTSLDPTTKFPLPTDVTLGHYTPSFLGLVTSGIDASTFKYITYYTPRPPRVAAPDTRNCAVPGQCPISRLDTFAFDNQADGAIVAGGGQHKASLRFYAWAAHNQMPLRQITIDWGDSKTQNVDDTKLKNRKPYCGVQKECSLSPGLTCQTDVDCPPATGLCVPVGVCENSPQRSCSTNNDCTIGGVADTCRIRTMFGNASEACQQDYFDFTHVYTCGAAESNNLPSCDNSGIPAIPTNSCYFGTYADSMFLQEYFSNVRPTCTTLSDCERAYFDHTGDSISLISSSYPGASCGVPTRDPAAPITGPGLCSRDPATSCTSASQCAPGDSCVQNLAPPTGCFDAASNSCRFTPRLMLQDNWGWCTGECRNGTVGGNLADVYNTVTGQNYSVRHPYGGCYAGNVYGGSDSQRIRYNSQSTVAGTDGSVRRDALHVAPTSECNLADRLPGTTQRPWVVYPGALELRRSSEVSN